MLLQIIRFVVLVAVVKGRALLTLWGLRVRWMAPPEDPGSWSADPRVCFDLPCQRSVLTKLSWWRHSAVLLWMHCRGPGHKSYGKERETSSEETVLKVSASSQAGRCSQHGRRPLVEEQGPGLVPRPPLT